MRIQRGRFELRPAGNTHPPAGGGKLMASPRAWVEVDLPALVRNANRAGPGPSLLPMIKADAYGLGAARVAGALTPLKPYAFGVATMEEGTALREAGVVGRIIVFFPSPNTESEALVSHRLDAAVLSVDALAALLPRSIRYGRRDGSWLHLEVDTGMGRGGLTLPQLEAVAPHLVDLPGRTGGDHGHIASMFTHLHSADSNRDAAKRQLDQFLRAAEIVTGAGLAKPLLHIGASHALKLGAHYHLDLVRPGICLYGGGPALESVVSVRARVLEVRELPPGSTVGYGASYITTGRERIATLGMGYADGVPLEISNKGTFLLHGTRVPVRGRVCMDVTTVDVSRVPGVKPGDVATLLGRGSPDTAARAVGAEVRPARCGNDAAGGNAPGDATDEITLAELAGAAATLEHKILTSLGLRLPRIYGGGPADG